MRLENLKSVCGTEWQVFLRSQVKGPTCQVGSSLVQIAWVCIQVPRPGIFLGIKDAAGGGSGTLSARMWGGISDYHLPFHRRCLVTGCHQVQFCLNQDITRTYFFLCLAWAEPVLNNSVFIYLQTWSSFPPSLLSFQGPCVCLSHPVCFPKPRSSPFLATLSRPAPTLVSIILGERINFVYMLQG